MRPLRTCSEGARLITERLTSDAKFQRPHSAAGPDLARLMLAPSNLREAITKRPPASDHRLGRTVIVSMYAIGSRPMDGSSWITTSSTENPGPLNRLKRTRPRNSTRRPRARSSELRKRSPYEPVLI